VTGRSIPPAFAYNKLEMALILKCPTCKKEVQFGSDWFPFCSDRCRLIDLGRWADEEYRIPAVSSAPPRDNPSERENDATGIDPYED
jgi:endogenous inhibitor of DNA gyrase (YacG/DUF329 family)